MRDRATVTHQGFLGYNPQLGRGVPMEQATAQDRLLGAKVGNYEVKQKLGEGGMGAVYLAVHPNIGKRVALKVLHPEFSSNEEVIARFFTEAKAVNDIQHPNIVDIIDYGEMPPVGGAGPRLVYFIMEFLAGDSLAKLIHDQAPLSPERAQAIADGLSAERIEAFARKWLDLLPHPFAAADREAGYRYDLSVLQAEFARTQVLDRPLSGRVFFEEVIRENLDLGRPDRVQLIFGRRVTKRTPGRFRTRVITEGVTPSLHIDYKHTRIKQYHKEGRALRTETTLNDTRDFAIGKRLKNLPALRQVGFAANRRLLDVQTISQDCAVGEEGFRQVTRPIAVDGQRAAALPFGDPRTQALFSALVLFCLLPRGFSNRDLREPPAQLLGIDPSLMTPGRMTYDLRRLRLHGLIERIPGSHRYRVTRNGLRTILSFTRVYARVLRPGLSSILLPATAGDTALRPYFDRLEAAIDRHVTNAKLAA